MKFIPLCLLAFALLARPLTAGADDAARPKAAESLLQLMDMQAVLTQSIDQMLDMQVKQNPMIAPYQQEMKNFFAKYMSWPALKDDVINLYAAEFTEPELAALNKFYQTPVGTTSAAEDPAPARQVR